MKPITDIRRDNLAGWLDESLFSQTAVARLMDLPSPSIVNQHVRGTKSIGDKYARRYEATLGLPENWLDTDHSSGPSMHFGRNALQTPLDIGDGYLLIPRLKITSALKGDIELEPEDAGRRFPVHTSFFREAKIRQDECATMRILNNDMSPRLVEGDTAILHVSAKAPFISGEIYVFAMNSELLVRRGFSRPDNGLRLVADNPDKQRHPDWEVSHEDAKHITVIARVIYTFGKV